MYELVCDVATFLGDVLWDFCVDLPHSVWTVSIGTGWGGVGDTGVGDDASPLRWKHRVHSLRIADNAYPTCAVLR